MELVLPTSCFDSVHANPCIEVAQENQLVYIGCVHVYMHVHVKEAIKPYVTAAGLFGPAAVWLSDKQ